MKSRLWILSVMAMVIVPGCLRHQMEVKPIKVEPVYVQIDVNVRLQKEIEESAAERSPVIGRPAPDFTLVNQDSKAVTLSNFRGRWVVLYFYPKDDTPGCTVEATEFTALLARFHEMNAEVLGISEDPPASHCDFISKHGIALTLLSYPQHKVMGRYGAWVRSSLGDWGFDRVLRTSMIIDPAGIIRHHWPEVMPQGHAARVLEKLAELQ